MPAGYSLLVQPVEYQARDVTADDGTVLLLCDFTSTQPGTGTQTRVAVFPVQVQLGAGRLEGRVLRHQQPTPVSPPSRSARRLPRLGWQQLLPQETASVSDELPA